MPVATPLDQIIEKSMTSVGLMFCKCSSKKVKPRQLKTTPVQRPVRKLRFLAVVAVIMFLLELVLELVILISSVLVEEEEDEDRSCA